MNTKYQTVLLNIKSHSYQWNKKVYSKYNQPKYQTLFINITNGYTLPETCPCCENKKLLCLIYQIKYLLH